MDDAVIDTAADIAYGVYHPWCNPKFTGSDRAWRGPVETNPMRRAVKAAILFALEAEGSDA